MKLKILFQLFLSFLKTGFTAFGGGYAVFSLLHRETVENKKWINNDELTDIMAISQTLPGAIYVNASTIVGYRVAGFSGAVTATTASVLPTFAIILFVTSFLWGYTENIIIKKAFTGVLFGVTALVIYTITKSWKNSIRDFLDLALAVVTTLLLLVFKINIAFVIGGAAVFSLIRAVITIKKGEPGA